MDHVLANASIPTGTSGRFPCRYAARSGTLRDAVAAPVSVVPRHDVHRSEAPLMPFGIAQVRW